MAAAISRYDLTIDAFEPDVLELIEQIAPHLRGHALWLLGEPGVGKKPLGRRLDMMLSRFQAGIRGVFFDTKPSCSLREIGGELPKKKKASI